MIDEQKFQTMEKVAEKLFRGGVFSAEVKSADTAFAIILAGDELGFDPMSAARAIALVKGKVSLGADALIGLVKRSPACAAWRVVETTATDCTITTQRTGDDAPTTLTYTIAMATRAGLTGSQTWRAHPEAMLRARCGAALARAVYPDVCGGLYEPDEAEEIKRGGRHTEPRDDAPAQFAPPGPLAEFGADLVDARDLHEMAAAYARADLGGTAAKPVADLVMEYAGGRGYHLNASEARAVCGGTLDAALALAYDRLAAVDRHSDDEDGDGVVADVVRVLRGCGSLAKAHKARVMAVAVATCEALRVDHAADRITSALRPPPPPPTGTDAPPVAPPADAHGAPAATATGDGAMALHTVLDPEETEARYLRADAAGEAAWSAHLAAHSAVFAMAGAHTKRAEAFRAAGVLDARRRQTLAAIEAREGRGPEAALQALDGYRTRRVVPLGASVRARSHAEIATSRAGMRATG